MTFQASGGVRARVSHYVNLLWEWWWSAQLHSTVHIPIKSISSFFPSYISPLPHHTAATMSGKHYISIAVPPLTEKVS